MKAHTPKTGSIPSAISIEHRLAMDVASTADA